MLTGTLETPMKRFDLMFGVNVRGTFACSQACIPYLAKGRNPHILNLSPPLNMKSRWFKDHIAYTMAKYGMSMCTLGMAAEFAARHRRQLAVAAHHDRDRGDRSALSRGDSEGEPQARDHGRCRVCDLAAATAAARPGISTSMRRYCARRASPTSSNTR